MAFQPPAPARAGEDPATAGEPPGIRERERLAFLEAQIGTDLRERVAKLEQGQQMFATKVELERTKVWGVVAIGSAGMSILVLLLRFVAWIWPNP